MLLLKRLFNGRTAMYQRPPVGRSTHNMAQRYLGTKYDSIKLIADNTEAFLQSGV